MNYLTPCLYLESPQSRNTGLTSSAVCVGNDSSNGEWRKKLSGENEPSKNKKPIKEPACWTGEAGGTVYKVLFSLAKNK